MVQSHIEWMSILDNGGLITMHDGRYIVVMEVGSAEDLKEWFLIQADNLDDALGVDGQCETGDLVATPYLTRKEALDEAYSLLMG